MDRRTWIFIAAGVLFAKLVEWILAVDLGRLAVHLVAERAGGFGLLIGGVLGLVVARVTHRQVPKVKTSSGSERRS
jgi:hypothetical protein